jgi:N-sulfoglucosamine sulfohydrolase
MTYILRICFILCFTASSCAQNVTNNHSKSKPLNVVLILTDDQGAHLSSMGIKGISTPNVDNLAKNGVLFNKAFAVVASCSPSRSSIMTGMYPHANGHWRNTITPKLAAPDSEFTHASKTVDEVGIHEYITTLPEILKSKGFYTGITQKFHMSPPWKFPYSVRNPVNNDPEQYKTFVGNFIEQAAGKPFFLQANISPPHRNFDHHVKKFPEFLPNADSIQVPAYLPDTPEMRKDLRKYYGSVQLADACAGAIIQELKNKGVYDNTLIIYTGDQGEPYHRAKASPYYAGLHVPFVVAGPHVKSNDISDYLISLIDIMPTILDFLDIEIPKTVQGKSLKSVLEGQSQSITGRTYVFGEHNSHGPVVAEHYPSRMVFDGRYYYIRNLMPNKTYLLPADLMEEKGWGNHSYQATLKAKTSHPIQYQLLKTLESGRPAEELYDMENDPGQLNNLINITDHSKKLNELRIAMDKWRLDSGDLVDNPSKIKTRLKSN